MSKERLTEYFRLFLCLFGLHKFTAWENGSKFIDNGGWSFGWVARYERKCEWCNNRFFKHPWLKSDQKRMIAEASEKRRR